MLFVAVLVLLTGLVAPSSYANQPVLQDGTGGTRQPTTIDLAVDLVQASAASQDAPTVNLVMRPTLPGIRLDIGGNSVSGIGFAKDYAGNRFDAYLVTLGNNTTVYIFKRDRTGTVVDQASVVARDAGGQLLKINSDQVAIDGPNVVISGTAYEAISQARWHYPVDVVWPGAAVPFPDAINPRSGAGELVYYTSQVPTPPPQNCTVDYTQIRTIIREEIRAAIGLNAASVSLKQEISGSPTGSFRQGLEDKSKDALREEGVLTLDNVYASHGLYARIRETSFQSNMEALRVYGVATAVRSPVPTPTPGP